LLRFALSDICHLIKGHAPSVVLYTQEQINDIRRFCSHGSVNATRSVLCVDRTFNVSTLYVTVTVFKHRGVVRKATGDNPLFLGPVFLHGDGKFTTYLRFFSHLGGLLSDEPVGTELRMNESVITGSDEEKAIVKALQRAFPNSHHLFCMLHCKDNVRHYLTRVGVAQDLREKLIAMLFGASGAASSGDEQTLENKLAEVLQTVRMANLDVTEYLQDKTFPKIASNCRLMWQQTWLGRHMWNNNNCESVNHILKMVIDWKPQRVRSLVEHIRDVVRLQYSDLQRALYGQGDFQLAPLFTKHSLSYVQWDRLGAEGRERRFGAFMGDSGVRITTNNVTSSDGQLTVQGTNGVARKGNQTQRPRGHRSHRKMT